MQFGIMHIITKKSIFLQMINIVDMAFSIPLFGLGIIAQVVALDGALCRSVNDNRMTVTLEGHNLVTGFSVLIHICCTEFNVITRNRAAALLIDDFHMTMPLASSGRTVVSHIVAFNIPFARCHG